MNNEFEVVESPDGWSLHVPGASDEEIREGKAPPLVCGPWEDDEHVIPEWAYERAKAAMAAQRFTYRTDAVASGRGYASAEAAIEAAIEAADWATLDSASEQELIEDGGWLCVYDDGVPEIIRGEMP